MKTLIITSFHPLISRNIIATPVIRLLRSYFRIVIAVPNFKVSYFEKAFKDDKVIIEGIEIGATVRVKRVGMLKRLAEALPPTIRASLGRRLTLNGTKKNFFYYYLLYLPASFFGRSHFSMRLIRIFDYYFSPRGRFLPLFKKYHPDLIFSTDIQNEHDVALMQDARAKRIPIVSMVRSWDNLVTRAIRFVPNKIIVHNDIVKDQAISLYGIEPAIISVTGIPHYDRYVMGSKRARENFYSEFSLDSAKKTILFFPLCDYRVVHRSDSAPEQVLVDKKILETLSILDANVIVRFPPNETVTLTDFKKPSNFYYDTPGYSFEANLVTTREVTKEDNEKLIDELVFADVVVCGPSTAVIDAVIFDVPVIFVNFYNEQDNAEVGQIYEYKSEHIVNIVNTGGVKVAKSPKVLLDLIKDYFLNRKLDNAGREKISMEQCYKLDSHSSERVVNTVLTVLPGDENTD
ncbi:MAG: hypothetical protein A3H68_03225 [Candidatus Taylorbacteria bacterium RIFCSPLOWO2_02_FULL_46_40]|uniref:UDP-N-acetylglucosamine 2-epimerase domain-containing protein n=1 Tax=Candidatus Taylorbacteria bacterium RIFCSPLOWO2_02_FULL_46_40 TaxID=1802329 RepID=A0A1G2P191_9BACT|nr:MAG: hypothetical protein A3H68_03225 [Candidatus Taylorbacteria bacterium RIFCSPLOWO2_02_FULL_46_40]